MFRMLKSFYQKDYRKKDFPFEAALSRGNNSFSWHWHEEYEILVCKDNYFTIGVNDHFYTLTKDEIIIIKSNEIHCVLSPENSSHLTMKFNPILLQPYFPDFVTFSSLELISTYWNKKDKDNILSLIQEIWKEFDTKRKGYQSVICGKLLMLQAYIVRYLTHADYTKKEGSSTDGPRNVSVIYDILFYISRYYKDKLTLKDCAAHFGFNTNYFSSLFSNATGITFHKYVQTLRLREFEYLLTTTDDSITEVCSRSGFSNLKTAYRIFKAEWNMSPSEYRSNFRKNTHLLC